MATAVRPLPWATLTIPPANRINNTASTADARQLSAAGSRSVVPLTYGKDRIGGLLLNVLPKAGDATKLLVQVLWGFAGSAVEDVQLNGLDLPGTATVTTYMGTQTTADSALVAAFAAQSITYTDTLEGFAYSVIEILQANVGTELQVACLFSGRKLYDPRKDSTAGGSGAHRLATPSTWEFSECPALALGDFEYSTLYGAGKTVDWASVATTADANDATIGSPAQKRRMLGVTFISPASVGDIAETLRAYAGCFLVPSAAGVKLLPDADDAPVADYDHADGTIASISGLSLRDLGNSPTSVEIIYTDTTVVPWRDASAFADLPGAGDTIPYRLSQVRMPGVHRYSQAYREAVERLNKLTLQDLSCQLEVFDSGILHQIGNIIRLTHPIGVTNKLFRVTQPESPAPGRWVLPLIEHDPACYSDEVETVPTYSNSGALISDAPGGGAGADGYSYAWINIYTRYTDTLPETPVGGSYTFVGDVFVPPGQVDGDPYWSHVVSLLHMNNSAADTSSTLNYTATGSPTFTAPGKFGSHCLSVNGTSPGGGGGNRLQSDESTAAGLTEGDFTVEAWAYLNNDIATSYAPVVRIASASYGTEMTIGVNTPGTNYPFAYIKTGAFVVSTITGTTAVPIGEWFHLALSRTGGYARLFVNGVLATQIATTFSADSDAKVVQIGSVGGFALDGKIDEVRLTKWGRYSADFAPPTAPFPDGEFIPSPWSRDIPEAGSGPRAQSRYLFKTQTPAVAVEVPYTTGTLVTWAAATGTTITLTNSGRTAAISASGSGGTGVRTWGGSVSYTKGTSEKRYFEIVYVSSDAYGDGVRDEYGLSDTTALYGNEPSGDGLGYRRAGNVRLNGSVVHAGSALAGGDVIGIAVDFASGHVWMSKNGTWLAGDPAAGTGHLGTLSSGSYQPACSSEAGSAAQVTLNAKLAHFAYAPPAGFLSWGDEDSSGWSTPIPYVIDGDGGADAVTLITLTIFKNSSSGAPSTPGGAVYDIATGGLSSLDGWSVSRPAYSDTDPTYTSSARIPVSGTTGTVTVNPLVWATAVRDTGDGPGVAALSTYLVKFTSDADGVVDAGQSALVAVRVMKGAYNDVGEYTITAESNDASITTDVVDQFVTIEPADDAIDGDTVTITASRTGYVDQVMTVAVIKERRTTTGPTSGYMGDLGQLSDIYAYADSGTARAQLLIETDGRMRKNINSAGVEDILPGINYYLPTTAGIGTTTWCKVTQINGGTLTAGTLGTWQQLTSQLDYRKDLSSTGDRRIKLKVEFSTASGGSPIVATALVDLVVEFA